MLRRIAVVFAVAAVGLVAAGGWLWGALHRDSIPPGAVAVQVKIQPGSTLRDAAGAFTRAGVLRHAWELRLLARLQRQDVAIKAGMYEVEPGIAPARLLHKLVRGEVVTVAVTIPEGLTARQTAQVVSRTLGVKPAEFLELVEHPPDPWRRRLGVPADATLEGYLFPQTYRFAAGVGASDVIEAMLSEFQFAFDDSLRARAAATGMTVHQVVTLASIVEAEATLPQERARIAAVYHNRLRKGMRLEADPTVAYAAGVRGDSLTLKHLQFDSPYNTYRHAGLPPGPIDSPGLACLRAALWPQEGFDALFFVADGEGGHRFARTWAEHLRNVRLFRRGAPPPQPTATDGSRSHGGSP